MGKYTQLFIDETRRHLVSLGEIVAHVNAGEAEENTFFEGRRLSHSIKGMALFERQQFMADLAYAMEKGFEQAQSGNFDGTLCAGLKEGIGILSEMIGEVERDGKAACDAASLIARIESLSACDEERVT